MLSIVHKQVMLPATLRGSPLLQHVLRKPKRNHDASPVPEYRQFAFSGVLRPIWRFKCPLTLEGFPISEHTRRAVDGKTVLDLKTWGDFVTCLQWVGLFAMGWVVCNGLGCKTNTQSNPKCNPTQPNPTQLGIAFLSSVQQTLAGVSAGVSIRTL